MKTTISNPKEETPVKYYGGQLDTVSNLEEFEFETDYTPFSQSVTAPDDLPAKYIVGCDWLELYLKGDLSYIVNREVYEKGSWSLVACDIVTKFYSCARTVYYDGELFGVILFQPRSKVLAVESISLKIDNQQLYKRKEIDLKIRSFLNAFEIEFGNYTRVDLYIDFNRFNNKLRFADFVTAYSGGQIEAKGKVQSFNKYHSRVNGEMKLTGFSYGSRSSDKYVRCYDKTHKLETEHKPYIKDYWLLNGFTETDQVYRFEIQMNSKFFNKTLGERLKNDGSKAWDLASKKFSISNLDSIITLLELAMRNYFEFFWPDESRVRNEDKLPFDLFDWQKLRDGVKRMYRYVRKRIEHKSITWRQKMIVARNMFREYVVNKQDDQWLFMVARVVRDYELTNRWDRMVERYVHEFSQTLGEHYLFDWNKLSNSFSAIMARIRFDGMQGKQTEFIPITYSKGGRVVLTEKTW